MFYQNIQKHMKSDLNVQNIKKKVIHICQMLNETLYMIGL